MSKDTPSPLKDTLEYIKDTPDPSPVSVPGLKRCAVAPSGAEACWELADPAMTAIPDGFLQDNTNLTGTLRVGPAVQTIGARAFFRTQLTGLDLSKATSLVNIWEWAFYGSELGGTIVVPAKLTTIAPSAFESTKLTGLDLSKATSLEEIGYRAFFDAGLSGTLVISAKVATIALALCLLGHRAHGPRPVGPDVARGDGGTRFL